jgi:hypothetical protein
VSECVCVSEEGGREGGGGGRGADTELKTKTPHVNVGNQINSKSSSTIFILEFNYYYDSFPMIVLTSCPFPRPGNRISAAKSSKRCGS